ncbi:helix-turn-helix domain-containing protein [Actinopolymorpha pittospori]|uniref:DNA-directed RNA polymerase specialized sigma subunit n=1 Tax=Actinopolymorpha pittospori TaxID=648752 RepID=A0A927N0E7_9ACTN|nr:DNA-directed RNA polymerase specialized sigma subunit [Actinopolymorpha pittospori]
MAASGPGPSDCEYRWQQIRKCVVDAGKDLSQREIATATGISQVTVSRILGTYSMQHQALRGQLQEGAA